MAVGWPLKFTIRILATCLMRKEERRECHECFVEMEIGNGCLICDGLRVVPELC